jgi:hypothetical protein
MPVPLSIVTDHQHDHNNKKIPFISLLSGIYECQISTTPHMSHFIHLNVIGELSPLLCFKDRAIRVLIILVSLLNDGALKSLVLSHKKGEHKHWERETKKFLF